MHGDHYRQLSFCVANINSVVGDCDAREVNRSVSPFRLGLEELYIFAKSGVEK